MNDLEYIMLSLMIITVGCIIVMVGIIVLTKLVFYLQDMFRERWTGKCDQLQ